MLHPVPYPDRFTGALAEANLRRKVETDSFRDDLRPLVADWPAGYDIDTAAGPAGRTEVRHLALLTR